MKSTKVTNGELAEAWINSQKAGRIIVGGRPSENRNDKRWAYGYLEDMCSSEPIRALSVILMIVESTDDESILDLIASGPLESLLSRRGEDVIDGVIAAANKDDKFADILGGVWKGGMSNELWDRIQKLV